MTRKGIDEMTDEAVEEKTGKVTEEKTEEKTEDRTGKVTEEKTEGKTEDRTGKVTEGKTEDRTGKVTEEKTEDRTGKVTEEKTEDRTGKVTDESSIVCIMCPLGCEVEVVIEEGGISEIKGYACENGREYAEQELSTPKRTVMSVVKCIGGDFPTVSVKTSEPVSKEQIKDVMKALSQKEVEAPVRVGDRLIENVCGLPVDIVATRRVERIQHL